MGFAAFPAGGHPGEPHGSPFVTPTFPVARFCPSKLLSLHSGGGMVSHVHRGVRHRTLRSPAGTFTDSLASSSFPSQRGPPDCSVVPDPAALASAPSPPRRTPPLGDARPHARGWEVAFSPAPWWFDLGALLHAGALRVRAVASVQTPELPWAWMTSPRRGRQYVKDRSRRTDLGPNSRARRVSQPHRARPVPTLTDGPTRVFDEAVGKLLSQSCPPGFPQPPLSTTTPR